MEGLSSVSEALLSSHFTSPVIVILTSFRTRFVSVAIGSFSLVAYGTVVLCVGEIVFDSMALNWIVIALCLRLIVVMEKNFRFFSM